MVVEPLGLGGRVQAGAAVRSLSSIRYSSLPPLDSPAVRRQVGDATVDHILDLDERLCAKARAYAAHWDDDFGCRTIDARRHKAEIAAFQRKYDAEQWRKALHALWFAPANSTEPQRWGRDDGLDDVRPGRALRRRVLCTLTMLIGRRGIRHVPGQRLRAWNARWASWNSINLVFWDSHSDGYGWSAQILEFHPWQLRYSLISDGECLM
jgi:hypothetical protein